MDTASRQVAPHVSFVNASGVRLRPDSHNGTMPRLPPGWLGALGARAAGYVVLLFLLQVHMFHTLRTAAGQNELRRSSADATAPTAMSGWRRKWSLCGYFVPCVAFLQGQGFVLQPHFWRARTSHGLWRAAWRVAKLERTFLTQYEPSALSANS